MTSSRAEGLYRAVWRWHFYAGLLCVPFVILLAITGSIYLFKPQVEAWIDRPYDNLVLTGVPASPQAQVAAALEAVPGGTLRSYEVRANPGDAARVLVSGPDGDMRVYVHPQSGQVMDVVAEDERLMAVVKTIHGELLMGDTGSIIVELAACWAIVMIATGLYLWWPRQAAGLAGILYPRLTGGGRQFWRDLHAVIGIWVSSLALFLLLSGLPWTTVWGGAFKDVKQITGMTQGRQDWKAGMAAHVHHDHAHGDHAAHHDEAPAALDAMVAAVRPMNLPAPVLISPPSDRWPKSPDWVARSDTQNRPQRVMLTLDPATGAVLKRKGFGDSHLVDRVVGYGIAAHEGQLFGPLNQALGVLTALSLIGLSVTGYIMWWQRRPDGKLGAPPPVPDGRLSVGLGVLILVLAVLLPVLGASLIAVALIERLVLRRVRPVRVWLGISST